MLVILGNTKSPLFYQNKKHKHITTTDKRDKINMKKNKTLMRFLNNCFLLIITCLGLNSCIQNNHEQEMMHKTQQPNYIQPEFKKTQKLINLDIYHCDDTKELTHKGLETLKEAILYSEEMSARKYSTGFYHINCTACLQKIFNNMFFYSKTEEKIIL